MKLVPATEELARAEHENPGVLGLLLGARVPAGWPPAMLAEALPWFLGRMRETPGTEGWYCWYGIASEEDGAPPVLVASAGFVGPPRMGTVEIGYSVVPLYQGCGYATEMVEALVSWALAQAGVRRVVAEASPENIASIHVLKRLGFQPVGNGDGDGRVRYERSVGH